MTGDTTYTDFGFRIIKNSGANGNTDLRHRGTGNLNIEAVEAGNIVFEISIQKECVLILQATLELERVVLMLILKLVQFLYLCSFKVNNVGVGTGIGFRLYDSANILTNLPSIFGTIEDNTDGAEDGSLLFQTLTSNSLRKNAY